MAPAQRLRDGQLVTLMVGLGLDLGQLHAEGRVFGQIHPTHVRVDGRGRPRLIIVGPPSLWTVHDDWVALLRLGRHLGASPRAGELSWPNAGQREGVALLRWLLTWAVPEPLGDHVGAG